MGAPHEFFEALASCSGGLPGLYRRGLSESPAGFRFVPAGCGSLHGVLDHPEQPLGGIVDSPTHRGLATKLLRPGACSGTRLTFRGRCPQQTFGPAREGTCLLLNRSQLQPGFHLRLPGQPGRDGQLITIGGVGFKNLLPAGRDESGLQLGEPGLVVNPALACSLDGRGQPVGLTGRSRLRLPIGAEGIRDGRELCVGLVQGSQGSCFLSTCPLQHSPCRFQGETLPVRVSSHLRHLLFSFGQISFQGQ